MNFLKIVLLPAVPVYAMIIWIRNYLFDKKIFKSKKVNAEIFSIGNITLGGSGKTPVTIYITELLKMNGKKVGVLSRGYRRKSRGFVLVSDGNEILSTVEKSGDEMYHTVLDCKVPAAVCENRVTGAEKLITQTGADTLVLDDAFQHRWIYRDLDIVVIEQRFLTDERFFINSLFPAGTMREPFTSLKRADAIIINRKFTSKKNIPEKFSKYFSGKKIFNGFYQAVGFYDLKSSSHFGLNEFEGQKSLVVSGIARPFSFLNVLSQTKVDTENKLIFRDHKHYTHKDIQLIRKAFYSTNSHSVVTTEKDAVKLSNFSKELDDIDIYFLKIKFKIDDEDSFKGFIFKA
ncbi:MAG: tetraacyldisaccharide 4'-kinase [Ignavibacteria bacterium]|nr:tetraacyldisaccharide 4'-kinase [Ignavibacteria bacterium]MBT8382088.1 tetraacyldisaccharide 4'-kinase [Ignavibacteria bacterium]MBT8390218.1 tetraacyldisaccharide 4'-kinase [Ignavibacteria bacterium]NNJ52829.1 tetraacyldisaccharide 4'-kinase [Ignavibacteriaceae bacterium]NNL20871.1 tetraacyldisaccharide 4'-kinase [Ignavibacteriaceae bacterium]